MTDAQIRKAVACGHGRAIQFLRAHPERATFELILSLFRRDQTFDPLIENRSDYMNRLADTLADPGALVTPMGELLFRSRIKRLRKQARGLLSHLAGKGNVEARNYLKRDFYRFRLPERSYLDAPELLGLEGLEMLLEQAKRLTDIEVRMTFDDARELFGPEQTEEAFGKHPEALQLATYEPLPYREPPIVLPGELLRRISCGERVYASDFRRTAQGADWRALAQLGLETDDLEVLKSVKRILRGLRWPLDTMMALRRALNEEDFERRNLRLGMLVGTRHPALRQWAIRQLFSAKSTQDWAIAFDLVERNAEVEDLPVVLRALQRLRHKPAELHDANFSVRKLGVGPTDAMLHLLYEHLRCDVCRCSVVEMLLKRGSLTEGQREECREDSSDETRRFIADAT